MIDLTGFFACVFSAIAALVLWLMGRKSPAQNLHDTFQRNRWH